MLRYLVQVYILAFAVVCLCSCSIDLSSTTDEKSTVTILGKSPEDFYSQFYFGRDEKSGYYRFLSTSSFNYIRLKDTPDQRVQISLYLFKENKKFIAKYAEVTYEKTPTSGMSSVSSDFEKKIEGTWSIDGSGNLVLGDFGVAGGLKFNERDAILLTLSKDINASGVKGKNTLLEQAHSSHASY